MPKLTIDGEELEVPSGTTILQAALGRGQEIPHYCYHPGLSVAGNCRMCLVEVEKAPKLVIACSVPVTDGMVVNTDNERVKEAQAAVQEFLLINHPLDCPICDQAGECRLQDYAFSHSTGKSRFVEEKLKLNKAVDIGHHVTLDQERCIQCSRCIRFCDEVTKTGELAFFERGNQAQIGIHPGKRLNNPYSGNVVDICPVGALTLKEFRFETRIWYLENTPSVCAGCARGCNVMVSVGNKQKEMTSPGQFDDRIKRLVPRVNHAVNGHWMCDEGRLSYQRLDAAPRLLSAQAPQGALIEWEQAIVTGAAQIKQAAQSGRAAAILSPRLTCETMFAWKDLFDELGGVRFGIERIASGEDDDLLLRADKGANSTGASWILGERADAEAIVDAATSGKIDTLIMVADPLDPEDTRRLPENLLLKVKNVIYVGPFLDQTAESASLLIPAAAWAAEDGTMVNFEGRVQLVRRCHMPRGEGRPGWRVVEDLREAAGLESRGWTSSADVLESLAKNVTPFEGITEGRIGLLGARGVAAAAGS